MKTRTKTKAQTPATRSKPDWSCVLIGDVWNIDTRADHHCCDLTGLDYITITQTDPNRHQSISLPVSEIKNMLKAITKVIAEKAKKPPEKVGRTVAKAK